MKKEQIEKLFKAFEAIQYQKKAVEYWSARDLQVLFEYKEWRNFTTALNKAKKACEGAGIAPENHFVDTNKMASLGSGSQRKIKDVALTRYACYLIAQNADPAKPTVAFAQTYFAIQTRKQELIEKRLLDVARVTAREKLSKSEKELSKIIYERGVDDKGFGIIRSKGDQALFGGYTTQDMKTKLGVPQNRPLADFLPILTIKAKDFAAELTNYNVVDKDLQGELDIGKEHTENNQEVRGILLKRGVKPENLAPAEDIKKVKRKLTKDEKLLTKGNKKKEKK